MLARCTPRVASFYRLWESKLHGRRMPSRADFDPLEMKEWLPGIVLLGIGAGTLFPNLSGVAVASAPGESFATATGLNSVARQVGAALGVAVIVAIIGTPSPLQALHAFDNAWRFACQLAAEPETNQRKMIKQRDTGCAWLGQWYMHPSPFVQVINAIGKDESKKVAYNIKVLDEVAEKPAALPRKPER